MIARHAALACVLAIGTGCAAGSQTGGSHSAPNVLTLEEIQGSNETDALGLIRRLRPAWLRLRSSSRLGGEPAAEPVVYLDNVKYGTIQSLRGLDVHILSEIRYLSGPDATVQYGTGHSGGAILVTTGR